MATEDFLSEELSRKINKDISATAISTALIFFTILNLIFTFARFHDFTGMQFLGRIKMPIAICIITGLCSISIVSKKWSFDLKTMFLFLVFEAMRALVGFFIFPNFVINDASQFYAWRDLLLYFISIMIPISLAFSFGKTLRILINLFLYCGFFLSIWGITHSGTGPGGHLGDENDLCIVLVFLLPFAFLFSAIQSSKIKKIIGLFVGIICILGIVATQSRGGFLGFVAVALFQFALSRNKLKWAFGAFFVTLASLPFIPEQYYKEIESISAESKAKTGTIDERYRTWGNIMRMWKDPRNTLTGVGLSNSRWRMREYEEAGTGVFNKSLAGRASHSFYFQILGDLGIWGVIFFSINIYRSIIELFKVRREVKKIESEILLYGNKVKKDFEEKNQQAFSSFVEIVGKIENEIKFIDFLSNAMLSAWFGFLVAGIGISVSYYPTFWLMLSFTTAIYAYWKKMESHYNQAVLEFKDLVG